MSEEENIQTEIAVQGTSFELEQAPKNSVDEVFRGILENRFEALRPDIKVTEIEPLNKIEYIQRKKYDIPLNIQQYWPKISAIFLNSLNRKEVKFEFKNYPNFTAIKKLCNFYSIKPIFSEHNTTISNGVVITNSVVTLQSGDMPYFLAHLYNIYAEISKEAGDLIWEVLKDIAEYSINDLFPDWKEKIYRDLTSWEEYTLEKEECKKWLLTDDCKAAKKYHNLSDQEKKDFLKGVISFHVEIFSTGLLSYVDTKDPTFIKKAFSSTNRTIAYIEAFHHDKLNITSHVYRETEKVLVNIFDPGFLGNALNALDGYADYSKSAKVLTSAAGAILKISEKRYEYLLPFHHDLLFGIGIFNIVEGLNFLTRSFLKRGINAKETEVDLREIANTFSNLFTLCNYEKVANLKNDSQDLLIKFKGRFLYEVIQSKKCPNVVDADCALSFLSGEEFVKKVLSTHFKNADTLYFLNDKSVTIKDFVASFNLQYCYESLQNPLVGLDQGNFNNDTAIDI